MKCIYFQCSNDACKFRFPAYEEQVKESRCPVCKSSAIHMTSHEIRTEPLSREENLLSAHIEAFLDNIRSALNVGSMFRTADGFGIKHINLCGISPTPEIKSVTKVSLGAERNIPWTYIKNGVEQIYKLKEQKNQIVSIEEHRKAENIFTINHRKLHFPMVIVVGNEICGIDPEILGISDLILNIPMMGVKKSLNVAVAFGIALSMIQACYMKQTNSKLKK